MALPLLLVGDLIAITLYREHVIVRAARLLPSVVLGLALGFLLLRTADAMHSRDLIGLILVVSAAGELYRRRRSALVELPAARPYHRSPP